MDIVPFSPTRHDEVHALWHQVFGYTEARNAPALSIAKKMEWNDGLFWVALIEGRVAGTVMAGYDGHRGWIYALAVQPALQRRGIGGALLAHAEKSLAALGCLKINLQLLAANHAVAAFYEARGFQVEPRISMGKPVTANLP